LTTLDIFMNATNGINGFGALSVSSEYELNHFIYLWMQQIVITAFEAFRVKSEYELNQL
jgi:hypothetical protein